MLLPRVRPNFTRVDHRGIFVEVMSGPRWHTVSYGTMRTHAVMGHHYHKRTEVLFFLTRGKALVSTVKVRSGKRRQWTLHANEGVRFRVYESHAIRFLTPAAFIMAKSRPYHAQAPDTFPYPVKL